MCGKYKCTRWNGKVYIQDIKRNPNCPQRDVDKWGNALQTVQGAKDDDMRTLHDASVQHRAREGGFGCGTGSEAEAAGVAGGGRVSV